MGLIKRTIEKRDSIESHARDFLIANHYMEEALNGHLCTKRYSDDKEVYINANKYYEEHGLKDFFELREFRDEIKRLLNISEFTDAYEYDCKRN